MEILMPLGVCVVYRTMSDSWEDMLAVMYSQCRVSNAAEIISGRLNALYRVEAGFREEL